jgi:hypothetical protein
MTNLIPYFKRYQNNTGFNVFNESGSMTIQQPYNPGTGDIFHSQEEIYQYVTSSVMTMPGYNPIDDLTDV